MNKGKRVWLNSDPTLGAYLKWYVIVDKNHKGVESWADASFSIADCNRIINLDIETGNRLENTVRKLKTIAREALACAEAIEKADKLIREATEKAAKAEKSNKQETK